MLKLTWYSVKLFFKGKLIRDLRHFYQQLAFGFVIGLLLLVGLGKMEINLAFAIAISSIVTGMLMPFLLKDIKMQ
ncbi:MAG: hypothetical protein ACTMUB_07250 [cyanobacterium endosymbiont of Rhopalodia musculus]|uniref:hypothetical protein n=1 Tax=cyanobacterium endosymbiont of Epithemia clementina EcSB TaxID=3034674 RepID=UPI0024811E12|nr:hypothetical protein [cyanobacterium endosymbiont of Epithemia clementina EcSB]WGT67894.1 hypothetical protein P3F56_02065 [cyanobacterium endosymbiont of Epithemia clementina EcSB]